MSNPGYLFAGFALVWGLAFLYMWMLSRRSAAVQKQLDALEKRVNSASAGSS